MKLCHGSNVVVDQPEIAKGKPFKDFGRGFYLSDTVDQAMEMAERVAERYGVGQTPVVSTFEFDESAMTDGTLKVKRFETYTEEWVHSHITIMTLSMVTLLTMVSYAKCVDLRLVPSL